MSKLPTESRPIRMDPDLASAIEHMIAPYTDKRLSSVQAAVYEVYRSPGSLPFSGWLEQYAKAIVGASGDTMTDVMVRIPGYTAPVV